MTETLNYLRRFRRGGLFLVLALLMVWPSPGLAEVRRVLVVPFSIHSDQDMSFLQKGITAMLSSRLTDLGKVAMIDQAAAEETLQALPKPLTRVAAVEAGRKVGADYVAFGSLTVFGNSISTDARFVETATSTVMVTLNDTGQSKGDVINHINHFAGEVNTRVFGRSSGETVSAAPAPAPAASPAPADPDQMNPEKKIWGSDGGMRIKATNPDTDYSDAKLWRSRRFKMVIEGLGMGDVDGDGNTEVVFASEKEASVYRLKDNGFLKVTDIELSPRLVCLTVDVADINGNGKAEIYLTLRSENYFPRAAVLEWDGTAFQTIHTAPSWYLRVLHDPQSGRARLYGQKGGTRSIFAGPVYSMAWINGVIEPQDRIKLPKEGNVLGFAYGDMTHDGVENSMIFTPKDELRLSTASGREEWTSAEKYGGKYAYLITAEEYRKGQKLSRTFIDPLPDQLFFIPQRIIMTDFDQDGRNEALVVKNEDVTGGLMSRVRSYREGRFECLDWDNVGLRALWRTRKFSGYISDYNLGDIDNDGKTELVFAVVKKIGDPMSGDSKSYLVSWDPYQQADQAPAQ